MKLQRILECLTVALLAGAAYPSHSLAEPHPNERTSATEDDYRWLKAKFKGLYRLDSRKLGRVEVPYSFPRRHFDWLTVQEWVWQTPPLSRDDLLVRLAMETVILETDLPKLGYAAALPALRKIEGATLSAILTRAPLNELIAQCEAKPSAPAMELPASREQAAAGPIPAVGLDPNEPFEASCDDDETVNGEALQLFHSTELANELARVRSTRPRLEKVILEPEGIGGGLLSARTIQWRPVVGNLRTIPLFYYQLCEKRKVDPEDPEKCSRWTEVLEPEFAGAGIYRFHASWQDGKNRKGRVEIRSFEDTRDWVIQKP